MYLILIILLGIHQIVCHEAFVVIKEVEGPEFENFNDSRSHNASYTNIQANIGKTILEPIEKQNTTKINHEGKEKNMKLGSFKGNHEESKKGGPDEEPQGQQNWKVTAHAVISNLENNSTPNIVEVKNNNSREKEDFKPSPELSTYYDLNNFWIPPDYKSTHNKYLSSIKGRKSPTLHSDSFKEKEEYFNLKPYKEKKILNQNKQTQEEQKYGYQKNKYRNNFKPHPYAFDLPTYGHYPERNIKGKQQDSKPTLESPVAIPAGGLYQLSHPLYAIQNEYQEVLNEETEHEYEQRPYIQQSKDLKKPNPWKNVVRLLTTVLPIGLLISALTPSVITVDSAVTGSTLSRRRSEDSDISYTCTRRLLCELQNADKFNHMFKKIRSIDPRSQSGDTVVEKPALPPSSSSSLPLLQNCTQYKCDDPALFTGVMKNDRLSASPPFT